jgi:hypothetical protein
MAGILSILRKTVKRGTNAVRRVGKYATKTVKRGTNTIGLTKRRRSSRRRGSRRQH